MAVLRFATNFLRSDFHEPRDVFAETVDGLSEADLPFAFVFGRCQLLFGELAGGFGLLGGGLGHQARSSPSLRAASSTLSRRSTFAASQARAAAPASRIAACMIARREIRAAGKNDRGGA